MALKIWKQTRDNLKRKTAQLIFFGIMLWPPIHAVASQVLGFSSWRFFGWGMYATPHPDSLSNISLIYISDPEMSDQDLLHVYKEFESTWSNAPESPCPYVFTKDPRSPLRQISLGDLCSDPVVADDVEYFKHFNSNRHLQSLVRRLNDADPYPFAIVVHSQQRLNLSQSARHLQSDLYRVAPNQVRHLGKRGL